MIKGKVNMMTKRILPVINASDVNQCLLREGRTAEVIRWGDRFDVNVEVLKSGIDGSAAIMLVLEDEVIEVEMIAKPSNLGSSVVWYFICPTTSVCCRQLAWVEYQWRHIPKGMYLSKLIPKTWRKEVARLRESQKEMNLFKRLNGKKGTKKYNGKPTKRMREFISIVNY